MTLRTSASILTSGRGTLTSRLTEMNGIRKRNAPVSHKESTSEPWIQRRKSSARKEISFENPQYEGKILYYEDKQLVERTPEEVQEELNQRVPSPLNDIVSYGASAACWLVAQQSGMLEDLKETFGAEIGSDLLRLAIYQYLDGGPWTALNNGPLSTGCQKLEYSRAGASVKCSQK